MSDKSSLQVAIQSGDLSDTGMMKELEKLNSDMADFLRRLPVDKKLDLLSIDKIARHADDSMDSQLNGLAMPVVGNLNNDQLAEALTVMLLHSGVINSVEELSTVKIDDLRNGPFVDQLAKKVVAGQEDLASGETGIEAENFARNLKRVFISQKAEVVAQQNQKTEAPETEAQAANNEEINTSNKPLTAAAVTTAAEPGFWSKPLFNATQYMADTERKGAVKLVQEALTPGNIAIGAAIAVTAPIWGAKAIGLGIALSAGFFAKGVWDSVSTTLKINKQKELLNGDPSEAERAKIQNKIGELRVARGEAFLSTATLGIGGLYLRAAALASKIGKGGQTAKYANYLSKNKGLKFVGKTKVERIKALKDKQAEIESKVTVPEHVKEKGPKSKKEAKVLAETADAEIKELEDEISDLRKFRPDGYSIEIKSIRKEIQHQKDIKHQWENYKALPDKEIELFHNWQDHKDKINALVKKAEKELTNLSPKAVKSKWGRMEEAFHRSTTGAKTPRRQIREMRKLRDSFKQGDVAETNRLRDLNTPKIDLGAKRMIRIGAATLPASEATERHLEKLDSFLEPE